MVKNLFIIILIPYVFIFLLLTILLFNFLIGLKYIRLWRKITVEYPKLESKMLVFRRYQNIYGLVPILHSDYLLWG